MAELFHSTRPDVSVFMESLGFSIPESQITKVYPIFFPNRRVFRISGNLGREDEVLKVRPADEKAELELKKLNCLFSSYRYFGGHFPAVRSRYLEKSSYVIFHMSYLGNNLGELASILDLVELGYADVEEDDFRGFSDENIHRFIDQLRNSHMKFAAQYGYIHGDLIQDGSPNNIVFNSELERLFLVDAEALAPTSEESLFRFNKQVDQVEEWMCSSLLL